MRRFLIILLSLCSVAFIMAQEVPVEDLTRAVQQLMRSGNPGSELRGTDALLSGDNQPIGYVFRFQPTGFIIASNSELTRPIYGFSFRNTFNLTDQEWRIIQGIMEQDLQNRVRLAERLRESERMEMTREWRQLLSGRFHLNPFQQWPPEGTTSSGGWIVTDWKQSAPYNSMCPMDLNAGARSVVGCPATAMGQILNYHETLNGTTFDDSDDYYHSYGSGNQYWIDDDHESRSFPSWDSLNIWLNTMDYAYQIQAPITMEMKAALSFACGAAAHQVYTASVSGTFGIDQAWESFQRFGFSESRLIFPEDTTLNAEIAENIKVALPVQLGLLVEPPGGGGHNVVVDGYNTDEYYHFNFGWGGSANGWYTLPPTNIAYNLTVIEGAVMDIKSTNYTGIREDNSKDPAVTLYPNPVSSVLMVVSRLNQAELVIYNLLGNPVKVLNLEGSEQAIHVGDLNPGIYLVKVTSEGTPVFTGKVCKN